MTAARVVLPIPPPKTVRADLPRWFREALAQGWEIAKRGIGDRHKAPPTQRNRASALEGIARAIARSLRGDGQGVAFRYATAYR